MIENMNQERPAWMKDELVRDISEEKLSLLNTLFYSCHGKSQREQISILLPLLRKAKEDHLMLTPNEYQAALSSIKKHSLPTEQESINNLLNKIQARTEK